MMGMVDGGKDGTIIVNIVYVVIHMVYVVYNV